MCSTDDLVKAARCEFALLRALDAELGLVPPPEKDAGTSPDHAFADPDELDRLLADLPSEHASEAADSSMIRIDHVLLGDPATTVASLRHAQEQTLAALHSGAGVIVGARFFDGDFAASCAALVRADLCDSPESDLTHEDPETTGEGESVVNGDALRTSMAATIDGVVEHLEIGYAEPAGVTEGIDPIVYSESVEQSGLFEQSEAMRHAERAGSAQQAGPLAHGHTGAGESTETIDRMMPVAKAGTGTSTHRTPAEHAQRNPGAVTHAEPAAQGDEHTDETDTANAAPEYIVYGIVGPAGRIGTLIELAACADTLRQYGFRVGNRLRLAGESPSEYELATAVAVYRARRRRLATILENKQNELLPVQWGDRRYLACGDCPTCTAELVTGRDLLLVAGMRPAVRAQLRDAGITTVDRLAAADSAVTGVAAQTFSALRRQAELQLQHERDGTTVYAVTDASALGALPLPSSGDVFLSVAGTPAAVGVGVAPAQTDDRPREDGAMLFHAFRIDEAPALLEYLLDRQEQHPELRIYHYHTPARRLLARLCARYGADEQIIDDLLGSLVDLYPILRSALLIGQRSYRLADLTGLFDPTGRTRHDDLESECARTLRLRSWLLDIAAAQGISATPTPPDEQGTEPLPAVEAALREFAFDFDESRSAAQHAAGLMAATLAYHRRERQPLHWAHTDRLYQPIAEWGDAPGVLVADWGTVDTKWHSTDDRPMRRYLTLTGRLGTGRAPRPGTEVLTVYDRPAPGMNAAPGRRATAHATILGCSLDVNFDDAVRVREVLPHGCEPYDELPVAIAPGPPGHDDNIADALEFTANQLLVSLPEVPATAAFDLLLRRAPRLASGAALPEVFGDHAAAVTAAVLDLDDSYVAVQGPPGTGKTDTGSRVVERLVTRYKWRVGVVAQSHWAVEHVLDALVRVGVLPELVAKSDAQGVEQEWLAIAPARYPRFLDNAVNGCVIGGLPGDFADAERVPPGSLDLLMVVDAGHFPLADAIAVAAGARNLLLLGDPAPLPGHGTHPEPVHDSVLGRLLGGSPTLPPEFGYFLDRTWRMHPQLCGPVSRLRYAGRLRSNETVTLARDLEGVPPGVRTIPIAHHGNSTESAEEAREIVRRVRGLLGLPWRQGAVSRRLHPHDILVVTPYHAQVARIRTLLSRARIEDVLVGTPERLAGREAAVVLVSMTTSSPAEAPHGIGTLLSRHWLTTAVSRAMWTAIIVHSALLAEYLPEDAEQMTDLAAFLDLSS
ncbi:bifunctional RecB family nuclease/DEAD/DEAH box helicase [Nocardia alni]|uniref:bifunctional RecB family nuclease/DEAD/DEAH box helicase n=1 Tax=Nocardia alni TaxID=2815723 RepID=UPI001C22EE81|nr:AAA domain-containing protein [Nocardia alni]